jgi:intracellular multiplication protein IcmL
MADAPKKPVNANAAKSAAQSKKVATDKPSFTSSDERANAIELVRLRNNFYQDNYRRLIGILLLLVVLMFGLVFWVYYLSTHRPQPRYFATNAAGGLVPLMPLNRPSLSQVALQNWSARAASAAFTFNYIQLRDQLQDTQDTYFTDTGATQYLQALNTSKDLDAVTQGHFIVTAQPTGAPVILSSGVMTSGPYANRWAWVVSVPLAISFQSDSLNRNGQRNVNVQLTIVRTSRLVDPQATNIDSLQGIGISQLLVQPVSDTSGVNTPLTPPANTSAAATTTNATV